MAHMKRYQLDVFEPRIGRPEAVLKHRRDIYAVDEQTAIEQAKQRYREFAADDAQLDRFVLYDRDRVVYEHRGSL
jgi:hypothetical protein